MTAQDTSPEPSGAQWEIAQDVDLVHELLCSSDEHLAIRYGLPVPRRNVETTRARVQAREVQLLRGGERPLAMFTLTWAPPFAQSLDVFTFRTKPAYLQRLVVNPEAEKQDLLLGARCVRHAIGLAFGGGADAIRSEANPDLTATFRLLELFGFRRVGPDQTFDGLRRTYLEKALHARVRTSLP